MVGQRRETVETLWRTERLMDQYRFGNGDGAVIYERAGKVVSLILDRPDKLNALTIQQMQGLREALLKFDGDDEGWVAILSGNGRAFCTGVDVVQWQIADPSFMGKAEGQGRSVHSLMYGFENWKPIIAAAHGYAVGAGLALVLQADLSVVSEDIQMQITEVSRGLGDQQFWRKISCFGASAFATEVMLTGRFFTGKEAANAGVVTAAVDAGTHLEAAHALAEEVLKNPPLSVRSVVRARRYYMQSDEAQAGLLTEAWKLHLTEDFRTNAQAFAESRGESAGSQAGGVVSAYPEQEAE